MPYLIEPIETLYTVYDPETGHVFSYATTLANAKRQVKLLKYIDFNRKPIQEYRK